MGGADAVANSQGWQDAAIRGYERFMYLSAKYRNKMKGQGTTPEVDFVWHLHTMHPLQFHTDCNNLLGFVLHHEPLPESARQEGGKAKAEGNATQEQLWLLEFGCSSLANKKG